jgi:nucleotide-binding universal stress UspA family protein
VFELPRILLPVDFSEQSIGAAQYAKALACRFHSELLIVHVIDLRVYGVYGMGNDRVAADEFAPGCKAEAEREMERFLADDLFSLKVRRTILYGDPAREIVKYGASEHVDMIVIPTHGRGPFRRLLLGSVTAKVLHDADYPVWTGTHIEQIPKIESPALRRILCALDPWDGHHSALAWAWQFGREVGGQLKIVHALPPMHRIDPYFGEEVTVQMTRHAEAEIQKAQDSAGSQAEVEIVCGETPKAVCTVAKDWNADLLVIGRGARTGILGRLRSRSYAIIREAPCPVVSV